MKEMTLRELQLFSLEILKDVHHFCIENGIDYSMVDGSLIGVARHKGFIPWDDDIDIIMRRPDYDRFCKTYRSDRFLLKCKENDPDYLLAFARVYDNKKTSLSTDTPWCQGEAGVSIDVLPADAVADDMASFGRYYDVCRKVWVRSCMARTALSPIDWSSTFPNILKHLAKKVLFLNGILADYYVRKVVSRSKAMRWGESHYWGQLTTMNDRIKGHHRIETFTHTVLCPFEDMEVCVMNGYEEYLSDNYKNYMELPPVEKRVPHSLERTTYYWK